MESKSNSKMLRIRKIINNINNLKAYAYLILKISKKTIVLI